MPRRLSRASVVRVLRPRSSISSTGQSSHILIRCSTRKSTIRRDTDFKKLGIERFPEVVREVGVHDFRMATEQQLFHLDHRLLSVSLGTVGVEFRWKVGFEDRLQHQYHCCHADPIPQG